MRVKTVWHPLGIVWTAAVLGLIIWGLVTIIIRNNRYVREREKRIREERKKWQDLK